MLLTIYTALSAYSTPINMVSAAFACIIDDTRTEVLEALIDLDRSGVMEHTMLESRFTYLAAYPEAKEPDPDVPGNTNDLELRTASILELFQVNGQGLLLLVVRGLVRDHNTSPAHSIGYILDRQTIGLECELGRTRYHPMGAFEHFGIPVKVWFVILATQYRVST